MAGEFALHERLAADTWPLAESRLSLLRLMDDQQYPWLLLVPKCLDVREIHELTEGDQHQLLNESSAIGRALLAEFGGDKLNVAALGNQVPQLHLHHVVRFEEDPAWPGPIWGVHPPLAYDEQTLATVKERLRPVIDCFEQAGGTGA
ncbi:diadenosine tetraphosphate (Ap4A) HIT family hydrolase [Tamilnaduibacter salinus]|uniref:Diadenosine tetraphosphate (Ap4A) HIT family hydrolase n=1 Tax=Tamilnaduibacter salinus TaxID=1484056 RepID=A0A2U1D012_9GAMM|nr:HIT domain-containing protein [Tamilnaduibacter salinus]PVY78363.1 diadenosine tetraphosphate (Ap4A) HIT family hydrolase [Tamilnaduibacter salinus]